MIIQEKWQDTQATTVTISAPGAGRYNILKSINVKGSTTSDITVSSPAATAIWKTSLLGPGGFDKDWDGEGGVRGAENQALVITVSAGTYTISANGVVA